MAFIPWWATEAQDARAAVAAAISQQRGNPGLLPIRTPHAPMTVRQHVLIGAGAGAVVGAAVGAISYRLHPGDSESMSQPAQIVGSALLGAIVGAVAGWITAKLRT